MYQRECDVCGNRFKPVVHNQKRCSIECKATGRGRVVPGGLPVKACAICSMEFKPKNTVQKYCSKVCVRKSRHRPSAGDVECSTCGNVFLRRDANHKYCSLKCFTVSRRNPVLPDRICVFCRKEYTPRVHNQKHCSMTCSIAFRNSSFAKPRKEIVLDSHEQDIYTRLKQLADAGRVSTARQGGIDLVNGNPADSTEDSPDWSDCHIF